MPVGKTYRICVPTWRRMGNTSTLDLLKDKRSVTVVVQPEEEDYYIRNGYDVMVVPSDSFGIGSAKHYFFLNCPADLVWSVDDDMKNEHLIEEVEYVSYHAAQENAGLFGLNRHSFRHSKIERDGEWSRYGAPDRIWGVDRHRYKDSGLNCASWPILEDLYVWIGMQVSGYGTLINNRYIARGGNIKYGGCDNAQVRDKIIEGILRMQETFPDYVSIFDSYRASIQNMKVGLGFRVAWKRIHEEKFKACQRLKSMV